MTSTIILGILSVLFASLARYKNAQWGLKVSFALIFLFLALRYNFGNDYEVYLNAFFEINQYNKIEYITISFHADPGWIYLNWLFRPLGFFAMIAVLALFNCVVYYRFIKKYVPVRYYWLAVFVYVFYPEFMLIHSSAMRQSVAIMLFVFSLDYLYKKNAIRYFLCIGLASLFHFSALILLPVYLLGLFNWKINRAIGGVIVLVYASLLLFYALLAPYLSRFVGAYFERYANYQDPGVAATGLGFLYIAIMLILALNYERAQKRETALIFKIAIISFMLMPLNLIIQLIGRVGMYFAPATMAAYPIIFVSLKRQISKIIFLALLLSFTIYKFVNFFHSDTYRDYFGTYQTIFSAPQWY